MLSCPECSSVNTQIVRGEEVCTKCGYVIETQIISESFQPETLADSNIVGGIQPEGYRNIYSRSERKYLSGKSDIELLSSRFNLPKIIERESLDLWKECITLNLLTGRSYEAVIYACVYLACFIHHYTLNSKEFISSIKQKTIILINSELELNLKLPFAPTTKIEKHASYLNFPKWIIRKAVELCNEANFKNKRISARILGILYYLNVKHNLGFSMMDFCRLESTEPKAVKAIYKELEEKYGKN